MGCNWAFEFHSIQCPKQRNTTEARECHVPQIIYERPQNCLLRQRTFDQSVHAPGGFCRSVRLSEKLRHLSQPLLQVVRGCDQIPAQFGSMELFVASENRVDY